MTDDVATPSTKHAAKHTTSVVIPALNEARNIPWVLERLPRLVDEVIVVDGRSTDNTIDVTLRVRPDARIVEERRPGKGVALRAGFAAARSRYIVMLDADGSMDPREIGRFVTLLEAGYDLVKGTRFSGGGGSTDISPLRRLGNRGFTDAVNVLYGTRFTDLCYGYIGFRTEVFNRLALAADGFEIETEIVVNAVRNRLRIGEVPSFELPRLTGASNLRTFRDGLLVLRTLVKQRLTPPLAALEADGPTRNGAASVVPDSPAALNGTSDHLPAPRDDVGDRITPDSAASPERARGAGSSEADYVASPLTV